ncbi:MAG: hypothetical protein KGZ58_02555 [Ignavibacteriales bacterium]|nr:hypothetical protein [Ignavibacteriales bacterium]
MKKIPLIIIISLITFISCSTTSIVAQNAPKSMQATFVESYSPTEVSIRAWGIGSDVDNAEIDAKKSAIYFVLVSATDPLLQTSEEKSSFEQMKEQFFAKGSYEQYIIFLGADILNRVKTKEGVKVEKLVRVNKEKLSKDLAEKGVLKSREEVTANIGNPMIMVLPEVAKGENPIEKLQKDANVKIGAEVIESYLTARKYDVQVPEQMNVLNELTSAQNQVAGNEEDIAYQLALSIGSDVYITFNVKIEKGSIGKKGVVGCRAYETTTAKLLGTETGYSPERPSVPDAAVIEEAMNDAIDKVLSRISAYWKEDASRGQQYKLIFNITGTFDDAYVISDAIDDVLGTMTTQKKQNIATEKTVDYIIWQKEFESTSKLFRELDKRLKENTDFSGANAKLKRVNVNRKLILVSIENGE